MNVLLGPGGLRSGWRAVLWVMVIIIIVVACGIVFGAGMIFIAGVDPNDFEELPPWIGMTFNAFLVVPAALVTWLFVRFLDRRPLASVGLGARGAISSTAIGVGLGLLAISAGCLALAAAGAARIETSGVTVTFAGYVLILFLAAAWEELLFRGYAFQWIARGAGFWTATALTSLLFGLAHVMNPNAGIFSFVLIVLSGVLLSFARAASRDLWVPIGLHFGWNAAQGLVFGVPISGITGWPALLETQLEGPEYVTGGEFGFEASLGGLIALVIAFAALVLLAKRRTPDWRMEGRVATAVASDGDRGEPLARS